MDRARLSSALKNAHQAGDVEAAQKFAAAIRSMDKMSSEAAEAIASKGPSTRPKGSPDEGRWGEYGTRIRDVMVGAAGLPGLVMNPVNAWANEATDAAGMGRPFMTAEGVAEQAAGAMGFKPSTTATGRVLSGVTRTASGILTGAALGRIPAVAKYAPVVAGFLADNLPAQLVSGTSGAVTGGIAAENTDNPWLVGAATFAGSMLPGVAAGGYRAFADRNNDDEATRLLLSDRESTSATTTDDVQAAVRGEYEKASKPYEARYAELDSLERPKYTPAPEVNPVEWGMPIAQAPRNKPISTSNVKSAINDEANAIIGEGLEGLLTRIGKMDGETLSGLKEQRSVLLSEARSPSATQNSARVVRRLAEAVQDDIDETLMNTAARNISRNYKRDVIGPFERVRKGGVLQRGMDSSDSWKAIKNAGREDLGRLSKAVSPETRALIRKRTVADIIAQEDSFTALQSGSGAPVWRDMDKRGMGQFFSKEEWRGLQRLTGRSAFFKHPATRVGLATAGAIHSGPVGVAGALFADWIATTTPGRLFMARAGRMTGTALDEAVKVSLANPGALQAEIQVEKDR